MRFRADVHRASYANLVLQNSYIAIMALGMLLVIVAGHIDLSVGSVSGFVGALAAVLMVSWGWHYVPATLLCLVVGALIGAAQGVWVAYFRIPSFIVTLAGMLVFKGLALALLQGALCLLVLVVDVDDDRREQYQSLDPADGFNRYSVVNW